MKTTPSNKKMRGGYYTPKPVAEFITRWAAPDLNSRILEPSCGDGAFLRELSSRKEDVDVVAVELNPLEADKASVTSGFEITTDDFFNVSALERNGAGFDIVLGNPPFIRYQNFDSECRDRAFEQMKDYGFKPNKLTNIWVPFLVISANLLKKDGRLGMVIPAELLQVNYASECRKFLSEFFGKITIISFKTLLFEEAQQEVVLLLAEKTSGSTCADICFLELEDASSLKELNTLSIPEDDYSIMDEKFKWTRYYLTTKQRNIISAVSADKRVLSATELFDVNVGLVSGENSFFLMNHSAAKERDLTDSVIKIVSRTEQLKGIVFKEEDFEDRANEGKKVFMFNVQDKDIGSLTEAEINYVKAGEEAGVNTGYKCRIRKNWFVVPMSWKPNGYAIRQAGRYPRLMVNETDATSTDTVHKVRFHEGIDPYAVSAAFINSYTFALAETLGRSYGGGVLTFEPSEIRALKIPMHGADKLDVEFVDSLVREGKIEKVLDYTDEILLRDGLGLDKQSISELRTAWKTLSNRRMNRKMQASTMAKLTE